MYEIENVFPWVQCGTKLQVLCSLNCIPVISFILVVANHWLLTDVILSFLHLWFKYPDSNAVTEQQKKYNVCQAALAWFATNAFDF